LVTGNAVWDLYFRPTFCSFMPLRARQISERAARAGQGIPKLVERSRVDPIACFRDTGSTRLRVGQTDHVREPMKETHCHTRIFHGAPQWG
jgi:hypothetical protein